MASNEAISTHNPYASKPCIAKCMKCDVRYNNRYGNKFGLCPKCTPAEKDCDNTFISCGYYGESDDEYEEYSGDI